MSQIYDFNPDFDYPMELRIVNFSKSKANVFIWQQDQKTLMRRIVSDTYNKNATQSKISQRLNQATDCNIQGMIGINGAAINEGIFNALIAHFFIPKDLRKEDEMKTIIMVTNELKEKFNEVTSQNEIFLNHYTNELLFATIYIFSTDTPRDKYAKTILEIVGKLSEEEKKMMTVTANGNARQKAINILKSKI